MRRHLALISLFALLLAACSYSPAAVESESVAQPAATSQSAPDSDAPTAALTDQTSSLLDSGGDADITASGSATPVTPSNDSVPSAATQASESPTLVAPLAAPGVTITSPSQGDIISVGQSASGTTVTLHASVTNPGGQVSQVYVTWFDGSTNIGTVHTLGNGATKPLSHFFPLELLDSERLVTLTATTSGGGPSATTSITFLLKRASP